MNNAKVSLRKSINWKKFEGAEFILIIFTSRWVIH